jgi:hypothetical protein
VEPTWKAPGPGRILSNYVDLREVADNLAKRGLAESTLNGIFIGNRCAHREAGDERRCQVQLKNIPIAAWRSHPLRRGPIDDARGGRGFMRKLAQRGHGYRQALFDRNLLAPSNTALARALDIVRPCPSSLSPARAPRNGRP